MRPQTVAAGIALVAVVAAIAAGLIMLGSPSEQRARRLDGRRLAALQVLRSAIDDYWRTHGRLPESIGELVREPRFVSQTRDPVTGREYRYRAMTGTTYQICADFDRPSEPELDVPFWAHAAGSRCFDLEAPALPRP
jgi:type II secretory pathway pseudopilin PulG